jgi:TRAP-type mannitol/chloroaromatic compound transport system substrate-binding protein
MPKRAEARAIMRRQFLLAGGAGVLALATPQVSRAQTARWRMQSAWAPRETFHEFALDYARKVDAMTGGRLKLDIAAGGSVVPPFQMSDAVHSGILDGGCGLAEFRHNKHKASALFGAPPSFGWDSQGFLAWFYYGGGEALYAELLGILRLNLVGVLCFPTPTQPLGWFRKEITGAADLRGLRFRASGLAAEALGALGATITALPGGDVVAAMGRGVLDATEASSPATDLALGFADAAKHYLTGSHHRQVGALEIVFNKTKFDALTPEMKMILRQAAFSASSDQLWSSQARISKDLDEIGKRGVKIAKSSPDLLEAQLIAWDQVIAEHSKEPFFAKVIASQKAWVRRTVPAVQLINLDSAALRAAYRHFSG